MNDFTKQELEQIEYALSREAMEDMPVYIKIQSMIDNFPKCDHRQGMRFYNKDGEQVAFETDIFRCRHCDILFKFLYENGQCTGHEDL